MAYIGPQPKLGQNREVDDISSGFNGSTTAFTLQVGGSNASPGSANNIIVSVNSVVLNPNTAYTINGSTITFTSAPTNGHAFFGLILGQGIDSGEVSNGSVSTAKLADDAVTSAKIADDAVVAAAIADNAVVTASINADAVTQAKIAAGAVSTTELSNSGVTTAKIADDAVNADKITAGGVDTNALGSDSVTTVKILNANVTTDKLADDSVTTAKIANDAVNMNKLADLDNGRIIARVSSGSGNPEAATAAQIRTLLNVENGATAGGGKILQVVSTTRTDTFSQSGVDEHEHSGASISVSITPASSSNKIFLIATLTMGLSNDNEGSFAFFRGGSILSGAIGDAAGSRTRTGFGCFVNSTSTPTGLNGTFLDSPSTTSSTTYDCRLSHGGNGGNLTVYLNRSHSDTNADQDSRYVSTITAIEVQA